MPFLAGSLVGGSRGLQGGCNFPMKSLDLVRAHVGVLAFDPAFIPKFEMRLSHTSSYQKSDCDPAFAARDVRIIFIGTDLGRWVLFLGDQE